MIHHDYLVEAKAIKKIFDMGSTKVEALRGIDIVVHIGEFLCIMGPSGSGKSTLMHILGCLDRPTEGTYIFSGQDVSRLPDWELSKIRASLIGFVFQTFNLIPQCNVLENVAMPFLYQEGRGRNLTYRAEKALDRVGLSARRYHKPSELSGGEIQRVAIARAIVVDPLLILADEPTGNLDSQTGETIFSLFRELNDQGSTLIVVTHNEKIASHCRRIIQLQDGKILVKNSREMD